MTPIRSALSLALLGFTALSAGAQASANPVSDALRSTLTRAEKNFLGSAETMPADKYGYKPTDKNMREAVVVREVLFCCFSQGDLAAYENHLRESAP